LRRRPGERPAASRRRRSRALGETQARTEITRRSGLGLCLLVGYAALLVLAGWRHEIRPSALDGAHRFAKGFLVRHGIQPGMSVFNVEGEGGPITRAHCVEVLGRTANGPASPVYPVDRSCPPEGLRLSVPFEETLVHRLLVELSARMLLLESGKAPPTTQAAARRILKCMAYHFGARARAAGLEADEFLLRWVRHAIDYDSGAAERRNILLMRWRRGELGEPELTWFPPDAVVEAAWRRWEEP
jgi:hypothetical protein